MSPSSSCLATNCAGCATATWARSSPMTYQHNPFESGYCTTCHNPHASDHRVLLIQNEQDLCITCHPYGIEFTRDQRHPPAAQRFCLDCHHPHASDYRGILVDNQRDLCFSCHPSVASLVGQGRAAQPVRL